VVLLYDVIAASLFGYTLGWLLGKLLLFSERRELIDKSSDKTFAIALAIFIAGTVRIFNANEILAVFMAGRGWYERGLASETWSSVSQRKLG
jgi:NhaP-type Na+/H+ or K+/H+ antiporter